MYLQRRLLLGIRALFLLISIGTFGYVLMVVNFIDTFFGKPSSPFELEDIMVADNSPLSGRSVGKGEKLAGLTILALRKKTALSFPNLGQRLLLKLAMNLR